MDNKKLFLVLDNIRSVHNVGSIFRTADAAGVSKIFLTGHTPAPLDRFGRKRNDLAKVALGAENFVAWESVASTISIVKKLKKQGVKIIAVELDKKAIDFRRLKIKKSESVAFILGTETTGISKNILKICDQIVQIPMKGKKESLNVSVTAGIILFGAGN